MTADPEKVMAMAMQMMEKVDAQLVRVYDKLDEIARERREEAEKRGGMESRLSTLEDTHRSTRALVFTLIGAGILSLFGWIVRAVTVGGKA